MINNVSLLNSLLIIFSFNLKAQNQLTSEDYDKAVDVLSWNTEQYVDRMNVRPHWQTDESFWYSVIDENGPEYVFFNTKNKVKKVAKTKDEITKELPENKYSPSYNYRKESLSPDYKKVVFIRECESLDEKYRYW